jgi:hypothetical protein
MAAAAADIKNGKSATTRVHTVRSELDPKINWLENQNGNSA